MPSITRSRKASKAIKNFLSIRDGVQVSLTFQSGESQIHGILVQNGLTQEKLKEVSTISFLRGGERWGTFSLPYDLLGLPNVKKIVFGDKLLTQFPVAVSAFSALEELVFGHGYLQTLTADVIPRLKTLRVVEVLENKLDSIPKELLELPSMTELVMDGNMIRSLPDELCHCRTLTHLSLERNNIEKLTLTPQFLEQLHTLRVAYNPITYYPSLLPATSLTTLSIANMLLSSSFVSKQLSDTHSSTSNDISFRENGDILESVSAMILAPHYGPVQRTGQALKKLGQSADLQFNPQKAMRQRYSLYTRLLRQTTAVHHPMVILSLVTLLLDEERRHIITTDNAMIEMVLHLLFTKDKLIRENAFTVAKVLGRTEEGASKLVAAGAVDRLKAKIGLAESWERRHIFDTLAEIAFTEDASSVDILELAFPFLELWKERIKKGDIFLNGDDEKELTSLFRLIRNAIFAEKALEEFLKGEDNIETIKNSAATSSTAVNRMAWGILEAAGDHSLEWRNNKAQPHTRGIRILSLDGGGMRGFATLKMIEKLEQLTGKRMADLFDLIVGTSSGAFIAVGLAMMRKTVKEAYHLYDHLITKAFSLPKADDTSALKEVRELLHRLRNEGAKGFRVMSTGSRYDSMPLEKLLRNDPVFAKIGRLRMLDAALEERIPKVAVPAAHVSVFPAKIHMFRSYRCDPSAQPIYEGSSSAQVWQALRSTSAAPLYFDEFSLDGQRFQSGGVVANNPTVVAMEEARCLWPGRPIDCIVSIGSGKYHPRQNKARSGMLSLLTSAEHLVESATSVEKVEQFMNTFSPLMPSMGYFRFQIHDKRCEVDMDNTSRRRIALLGDAVEEYYHDNRRKFADAAAWLLMDVETGKQDALHRSPSGTLAPVSSSFVLKQLYILDLRTEAEKGRSDRIKPEDVAAILKSIDVEVTVLTSIQDLPPKKENAIVLVLGVVSAKLDKNGNILSVDLVTDFTREKELFTMENIADFIESIRARDKESIRGHEFDVDASPSNYFFKHRYFARNGSYYKYMAAYDQIIDDQTLLRSFIFDVETPRSFFDPRELYASLEGFPVMIDLDVQVKMVHEHEKLLARTRVTDRRHDKRKTSRSGEGAPLESQSTESSSGGSEQSSGVLKSISQQSGQSDPKEESPETEISAVVTGEAAKNILGSQREKRASERAWLEELWKQNWIDVEPKKGEGRHLGEYQETDSDEKPRERQFRQMETAPIPEEPEEPGFETEEMTERERHEGRHEEHSSSSEGEQHESDDPEKGAEEAQTTTAPKRRRSLLDRIKRKGSKPSQPDSASTPTLRTGPPVSFSSASGLDVSKTGTPSAFSPPKKATVTSSRSHSRPDFFLGLSLQSNREDGSNDQTSSEGSSRVPKDAKQRSRKPKGRVTGRKGEQSPESPKVHPPNSKDVSDQRIVEVFARTLVEVGLKPLIVRIGGKPLTKEVHEVFFHKFCRAVQKFGSIDRALRASQEGENEKTGYEIFRLA